MTPDGPKMGVPKLHPQNWAPQGSLAHGPKMGVAGSTPRWAHVGSVAHLFGFGLERVSGDGEWVERLPLGWGWGMAPLLPLGWGWAMG